MADATPTIQDQLAASIASAGTSEFKPVVIESATKEAAPATDKPEAAKAEPAPVAEQPAAEVKNQQVQPEQATEQKPDGKPVEQPGQPAVSEKGEKGKTEEKPEEALMREALGLPAADPETVEVLKEKYENSSKEAHRLVLESKAQAAALAEAGVEFTRTADGKFALKANQKYLDSLKDEDLPNVYTKLDDEDKKLVHEDVAKKIVKMALSEVLPKRPIAKATGEDAALSEVETSKAFDDLAAQKLSNGQPKFADLMEATTLKFMRELYDHPSREGFRKWMNQSAENFKEGLSLLHASVFRVRAPLLAMKKDAEAAKKQEEEKLKKKPATVASGAGITPDAMRHKGTPAGKDASAIALGIASAKAA